MTNFSTLSEIILFQAENFNNSRALNFKENNKLKSFSNIEFRDQVFYFACGLRELGLESGAKVAISSYQNPLWLIADFGSILSGAITVPIFHNIAKENLLFEISDAEVQFVFCDSREVFDFLKANNSDLKIITYGFVAENSISFDDLISSGKAAAQSQKYDFSSLVAKSDPEDVVTIIYTSGSTGKPKGVELTNTNLVSQVKASGQFFDLNENDVALSFLPLAHIFERMVMTFYISRGVSVYFADDIKNIGACLAEVRPTLLTTVPRMLEKVFARIKSGTENATGFKKFIGKAAFSRATTKDPLAKKTIFDKIFDVMVFKKFRAAMGGNIRMIICGGASLSKDLECFYKNIGINLFCGYGMTETSPVIAANSPKDSKIGTVGKVFSNVEVKIAADRELLVRGPNLMKSYHNQPEKTAEIIQDGWLKTGDLAMIDEEGFVKIIGRKKEVFKNANGKYVDPILIEQKLIQTLGFLLGSIVIAEGKKFTSAILFPDFDVLLKLKEKFAFEGSDQNFLKSEALNNFVQEGIFKINKTLNNWENVQKFHIATKPISIDSGEITPSMKLKRCVLEERFKDVIDGFYQE